MPLKINMQFQHTAPKTYSRSISISPSPVVTPYVAPSLPPVPAAVLLSVPMITRATNSKGSCSSCGK
jgi:hypothetical protein